MLNNHHSFDRVDEYASLNNAASLVAVLRFRAQRQAHRIAYTFLENGERPLKSLTYGELDVQARQLAVHLQALGLQGERAVLLYPPDLDYIVAFFACLYAGAIAVPAYPPSNGRHMPRLQAIVDDSRAAVILSPQSVADTLRQFRGDSFNLLDKNWLATDHLTAVDAELWRLPLLHDNDPAFLQYTSGSTGEAKGVIVSHGNLMANQQLIKRRFGHTADSTVVGWLPLYHDMGLIGNVMQPLYCGAGAILMSPLAFLEKPVRWLQAISDYRAHTSGGPNFAFELCTGKISAEEKAGLDLSSWRLAFNGAEPVNPATLARFSDAFAECGFKRQAFYPCYGLAEATLLATGGDKNTEPTLATFTKTGLEQGQVRPATGDDAASRQLVGCGGIDAETGQRIRIVDPESGERCRHDQIGEIQLGGPSISLGYWHNQAATTQTFTLDADGQSRWLRTGDLGFIQDGELFVSGRLKDLIIIRGRNYYPHDLEYAVEAATDALTPGATAAFALNGGDGEKLVVLAELKRNRLRQPDYRAEFAAIRTRLVEECGIQVDTVMLLKPGAILKTSSGKIRRSACRQAFEQRQLKIVAADELSGESAIAAGSQAQTCESAPASRVADRELHPHDAQTLTAGPSTTLERSLLRQALLSLADDAGLALLTRYLTEKVAMLGGLAVETIDSSQSLPSLGLDSLKAVELKYFIDDWLMIDLPVVQLLGNHSLAACSEQALKLAKTGQTPTAPVTASHDHGELPLSFGQQALWTANRIAADSALYNMAVALRLRSRLDKTALHTALLKLFERHPQLGSGFRLNRQAQTVCIPTQASPQLVSVTCADETQRRENIAAFMREAFDLEHGPLLRAALFSCADDDHVLAFCAHHLVVDFRSLSILLDEFKAFYRRPDADLPKPVASYADYVAWQSAYLAGSQAEQDWHYWQRQLSGELPQPVLPAERQKTASASCRGRAETLNIAADTLHKLKQLAADRHTSLYTLLLTVFKTLLYRYSGQQDIIVGSPTLGRPKREFADTVGYFVNPVALRSHPAAEQRFSDYLAAVNATVLDALAHQHYPFSLLVEKLQPEREHRASAFYRTWFVLQSGGASDTAELALGIAGESLDWAGLAAESYAPEDVGAQFDIALLMAKTRQGLAASFQYRSDTVSDAAVQRLIGHFQCLLHGILADPDTRLSELPLLTPAEHQQLAEWNASAAPFPRNATVHSVFEAVAREQPQAVALVYRERSLSYAELNAQANRLAHWLLAHGAGPEKRIALCIRRCPELVVGILAIVKAGAVYVPIDPAYPKDRQTYLMQDAGCEWLLTEAALLPDLDCGGKISLCIDAIDAYADYSGDNPEPALHADHAAYVIYTSGSTGKPKGVIVSHGNLMHSTWARTAYYREPVGCFLLLSSFAFDSSVAGIFWTLSQGGCLCLPEDSQIKEPSALGALIERRRVSHLLALPPLYELLLEQVPTVALKTLNTVIVAGEACTHRLTELHCQRLPDTALFNEYGPTEATVWTSVYAITRKHGEAIVPIGKAIANMRIYIADDALQPVPVGVAGEVLIGGSGISRGYLDQAGLTAERFIPDPFGGTGGRLYKTGDRARYLADGNIEFLGRVDQQVKIRGYRIELGEIEACLLRHPSIKTAAVIVHEDLPGNKRLAAYLVAEHGNTADTEAVKTHLKQHLPEYMLPSAWLWLDAMPLNANGKLDRNALPASAASCNDAPAYVAPRDEAEQAVADIWREVLGVRQVSIHDDFFELGGHSLSGVQVTAKVQELFNIEMPVNILFEAATVAQYVERLAEYQAT